MTGLVGVALFIALALWLGFNLVVALRYLYRCVGLIDCHRNPSSYQEGLVAVDGSPIEQASIDCAVCHY